MTNESDETITSAIDAQINWTLGIQKYEEMVKLLTQTLQCCLSSLASNEKSRTPELINLIAHKLETEHHKSAAKQFKQFIQGHSTQMQHIDICSILHFLRSTSVSNDIAIHNCVSESVSQSIGALIKAIALSKQNRIEFLSTIMDTFDRYFIDHCFPSSKTAAVPMQTFSETFSAEMFVEKMSNFIQQQQIHADNARHCLRYVVEEMHLRFKQPFAVHPKYVIWDDLHAYIEFYYSLHEYLNSSVWRSEQDERHPHPIQFDVWTIPRRTVSNNTHTPPTPYTQPYESADDSETDDTSAAHQYYLTHSIATDEKETQCDDIGDIQKRLSSHGMVYYMQDIPGHSVEWTGKEWACHFENFLSGKHVKGTSWWKSKRHPKKFERYSRYVIIYDRRATQSKKHQLYIFKAGPKYSGFNVENFSFLYQFESFYNSKQCLLPENLFNTREKRIGAYHGLNGYMFAVSYHLYDIDCIRAYFSTHGGSIRLYNNDVYTVWPSFFKNQETPQTPMTPQSAMANVLWSHFQPKPFPDQPYARICRKYDIQGTLESGHDELLYASLNKVSGTESHSSLTELMRIKLNQKYTNCSPGETFSEIVKESQYDSDGIVDDVEDTDCSLLVDKLIEKTTLTRTDHEGILAILLPIAQQRRLLHQDVATAML